MKLEVDVGDLKRAFREYYRARYGYVNADVTARSLEASAEEEWIRFWSHVAPHVTLTKTWRGSEALAP